MNDDAKSMLESARGVARGAAELAVEVTRLAGYHATRVALLSAGTVLVFGCYYAALADRKLRSLGL
jgi:hypothetical protein